MSSHQNATPQENMPPSQEPPKDGRMDEVRKKLQEIGQDLQGLRVYLESHVPRKYQRDFQCQIQRAFNAGMAYNEVQNIPQSLPVDEQGMLKIGPLLREHILETRKVYADVDELRAIVAQIFNEKSEEQILKFNRRNERKTSGSDATQIAV